MRGPKDFPISKSFTKGVCSVVIPVYNRERLVAATVESCLSQDHPLVEIILVDDGSTDGTPEICECLTAEPCHPGKTVRLARQENAGACVARNRGMEIATGEFLLFLDSDDFIPPQKLARQIDAMESAGSDCSICDFQTIDASGKPLMLYRNDLPPAEFIMRLRSPSNSAIVMRRSSMPDSLKWNTSLKRGQDLDFMLRYLSGVRSFTYVPEPLYYYRLHDGPRISGSHAERKPYAQLFLSMLHYLSTHRPATIGRAILLARYGAMLLRSSLKDAAKRILPLSVRKHLKALTYNRAL